MEKAIEAIRMKKISIRKAAAQFNVPRSTIQDILKDRYTASMERTVLCQEEERKIVLWLQECSSRGRGKTKEELALVVQKDLNSSGQRTSFTDNKPGRSWFRAFFDRHPNIRLRKTSVLGDHRARVTEEKIRGWFREVERNLRMDGIDISTVESRCIFNCDETGFPFHTSGAVVLTDTSNKHPYDVGTDSKHQISVLCCASAAGQLLPPCIIFPGMRWTWRPWNQFKEAHFALTSNGWMNSDVFLDWLSNTFIPTVQNLPRPVILFVDGHQSHVSMEVHEFCRTHKITYYVLPAHASHIVQPLDLIFYGCIKEEWRKAVRDFKALAQVGSITKATFTPVFRDVWARCYSAEKLVKAFECSGLHPWNPNRPDYSKCQASLLYGKSRPQSGPSSSPPLPGPFSSTPRPGPSGSPSLPDPSSSYLHPGASSSSLPLLSPQPGLCPMYLGPSPASPEEEPSSATLQQPGLSSSLYYALTEENLLLESQVRSLPDLDDILGDHINQPSSSPVSADPQLGPSSSPSHYSQPRPTSQSLPGPPSSFLPGPSQNTHGRITATRNAEFLLDQLCIHITEAGWSVADYFQVQRRRICNVPAKAEEEKYNKYLQLFNELCPPPTFDTLPIPEGWSDKISSTSRVQAPKYVSSKTYADFIGGKAKIEEQKRLAIEERKKERELKRAEKEEEKKRKKEEKTKAREEKKRAMSEEKKKKKKKKGKVKGGKGKVSRGVEMEEGESESGDSGKITYMDDSSGEECLQEMIADVDESICFRCGEDQDLDGWIGCDNCLRWYHRGCCGRQRGIVQGMGEEEISGFRFTCDMCSSRRSV